MTLLALLPPPGHARQVAAIQVVFALYALASLVVVLRHMARARPLVDGPQAPPPYISTKSSAGLLSFCVFALLFLPPVPLIIAVMLPLVGLAFFSDPELRAQFGLARLPLHRVLAWAVLICGAVIAIDLPLGEAINRLFDALRIAHPEQDSVEMFRKFTKPGDVVLFLVQAIVYSPLLEELLFRGFLFGSLKRWVSTPMALVLSSAIFALAHLNLGAVLPLWILGIVLGLAYEHTGSLVLPYAIHACWNLLTALSLLLDKGGS